MRTFGSLLFFALEIEEANERGDLKRKERKDKKWKFR
jgi:hypothetical protein